MAAHGAGFDPDAEQFGFDGIQQRGRVMRRGQHRIERGPKPLPRGHAVNGRVLVSVGHPDVVDAWAAQFGPDPGGDVARAAAVFDPEIADARVGMGQGQVVISLGMAKESGVEIKAKAAIPCPIHPRGEVAIFDLIAVGGFRAVQIAGMQVQAMLAGDIAKGEIQIGAQFIGGARAAGVVAGGLNAAARRAGFPFEPAHVIALPAMDGDCDARQGAKCGFGIDTPFGKGIFCQIIGFGHCFFPRTGRQRVKASLLPASTFRILPVDFAERSEAKKYTPSAMSSGRTARFRRERWRYISSRPSLSVL